MSDPLGLTGPEQRAILIMARWAHEAGLRRCRWSLPNDASWPHSHLAGLPVRHDGLPDQYDLLARPPWRPERVVCSLYRGPDGYEVTGVPGEEWLRREPGSDPAPVQARPRVRLTAAVAGLLVPVGALGGLAVATTVGQQDPPPPPAAIQPERIEPAPTPPLPANADAWSSAARVRLAAMSQQLEKLTAAEAAWTALPPQRRAGQAPVPVRELRSALAEVTQQRAALAAELDALDALRDARTDLAVTEQRLAEVHAAMATGDTTAAGALQQQADRLARESAAQRGQLAWWQQNVEAAIASPLPEPVSAAPAADAVVALAEQDRRPDPEQQAPAVAAGREVEPDAVELQGDDDEPEPEPPDGSGRHGTQLPEVIEDAAPVDVELPQVGLGGGSDTPAQPGTDDDAAGLVETRAPAAEVPQDTPSVTALESPAGEQGASTSGERESIGEMRDMINSEVDAVLAAHGDEINAAVDRMAGMTLEDLVRQDGETDQELRERLTRAVEDYQRQSGWPAPPGPDSEPAT